MTAADYVRDHNPADESAYYETCQNLAAADHLDDEQQAPDDTQPAAA